VSFGAVSPNKQIYGCDIDPDAFGHLANLFESPVDLTRFHKGDFLHQDFSNSWIGKFDAVIGNPPYLPYRYIDPIRREAALQLLTESGLKLDRRASLWAYFVALSIRFVNNGGRMAWVLPSSFLYANYSHDLRRYLVTMFSKVRAFELQERQFLLEGTEEKTVVLLAEGKHANQSSETVADIPLSRCSGVRELSTQIDKWASGELTAPSACGTSVFDSMSKGPRDLYMRLVSSQFYHQIGDHLRIQIGLVTGNNKFFLCSDEESKERGLFVDSLTPVLPRFVYASGLEFRVDDFDNMIRAGGKGYLVSSCDVQLAPAGVLRYLATYPEDKKGECSTFKKRAVWSQTDDGSVPDVFFPVMQHNGPRLLLNKSAVNCTNSVHRGYFRAPKSDVEKHLIALTTLSTFSQLSAEIAGRSYGSGALKHEPREAERIGIMLPPIHRTKVFSAYQKADRCLRSGHFDEASQIADSLILEALMLDDVPTQASILRSGLMQVRKHRQR
jgi:adenine-specific DNA-methyltransferase